MKFFYRYFFSHIPKRNICGYFEFYLSYLFVYLIYLSFTFIYLFFLFFLFSAVRRPFPHFTDTLKSQTSLTLFLKHNELTNEKVSPFLTNQSKTRTFIELKVTRKPKPLKIAHDFIFMRFLRILLIETKGYDVICVNLFHFKKTDNSVPPILLSSPRHPSIPSA